MSSMDIDLVYLWVDGNDPKWMAKRNACIGTPTDAPENCKGRYQDNDELKYSLRSVELYAPWIRKIFIVTDDQVPAWLDTANPKIQMVDHTEILPPECLPCFNSSVIEHFLYRIPGLSEHFLYANDDMYINRQVRPDDFFGQDGLPIIRLDRRYFRKPYIFYKAKILGKRLENYPLTIHTSAQLVEKKYGVYYNSRAHHNIDAYLKSTYRHAHEVFEKEINATLCNHMRAENDIQRILYSYVALAEKRAHKCYVSPEESLRLRIDKVHLYEKFDEYDPLFFCLNDTQLATDDHRRRAQAFISQRFPVKSKFENSHCEPIKKSQESTRL